MESVASTLNFIRTQSAARRCDYIERWRPDGDDADANATSGGDGIIGDDRPKFLTSSFRGDHKYEYAASPTAAATVGATSSAGRPSQQHCIVECSSSFIGGDRSVSSYVRATATDASVYSRASYSEYSLPSSAPTTRSTMERLHRAGTLLQGLSYAQLDLPINADAVDRLRAKLDRFSKDRESVDESGGMKKRLVPRSAAMNNNIRPVPTIVDCVASGATSFVDTNSVASVDTRRPPGTSRPSSAISAISSASRFSTASSKKRRHPTTSCVFDPTMLQGSRRTALKAAKRAKDEAAAKSEERRKRLFKARPLPCGGTVTSNLFAPTKASVSARACAMANTNDSIVSASPATLSSPACRSRPGTSHSRASRASFSSLPVSFSQRSTSKSLSPIRSPSARKPRRNTAKRRRLLAEIDAKIRTEMDVAIIPYDQDFADDNDDVSVASEGNDMSTLQHQVAILEAQLRQTRSYNERIMDEIEELDNLECIDDVTIAFDEDNDDGSKCRWQNCAYDETPRDNSHHPFLAKRSTPLSPSSSAVNNGTSYDSIYRRQEQWASTVETKRDDARLKKADRIMSGFTGKPGIINTEGSWQRAKEAHDAAVRKATEEQERKNKSRDGQPETLNDTKPSSIDEKKEEAAKPPSKQTIVVDRKRQADYSERLARPRSITVPPGSGSKPTKGDNDNADVKDKGMVQRSPFLPVNVDANKKAAATTSRRTPTVDALLAADVHSTIPTSNVPNGIALANEKSFADMNDREFSNVMRRLGIKSVPKADGKKRKKKPSAVTLSLATLDSETASKLPIETYLGTSSPTSNGNRPPAKVPPVGGGRFVSSEAQANLFKKITDQKAALVANKMEGPFRSTSTDISNKVTVTSFAPIPVADHQQSHTRSSEKESALSFKEPYQRYEAGQAPFFDKSSSDERGRFRVLDASSFDPNSMRRIVGPDSDADDGVMLLVGRKLDGNGSQRKEYAITILFDRRKFNEEDAENWWRIQRHRFV